MTCQYRLSISISTGAYLTFYEGRDKGGSNCAAPNMLFLKMAIFVPKNIFLLKKMSFCLKNGQPYLSQNGYIFREM